MESFRGNFLAPPANGTTLSCLDGNRKVAISDSYHGGEKSNCKKRKKKERKSAGNTPDELDKLEEKNPV